MAVKPARARVLVVDDEPLIRWAVAEILSDRGCQVVQACDGHDAVSAVSESAPFDIVVLDVRLPDCDDLQLLATLRAISPASRIILMTAHGTPEMTSRALDLGAFSVVSKPFELSELAALVSQATKSIS